MNPDIVSQLGTMVARAILTAMALVASLTGVILFVESLRRWRIWETELKDSDRDPEMAPAAKTALMSFEASGVPKVFNWHRDAAAARLPSSRSKPLTGPPG